MSWLLSLWRRFRYVIGDGPAGPLLVRYRLISTRWGGVYLHHLMRSDLDRDLHDHPWAFWSLILWRGYYEYEPLHGQWSPPSQRYVRLGERIPLLLRTPAVTRWVSYEPALGPVDFNGDPYSGPGWLRGWRTEPEHWRGCDGSCSAGRCPEPVQVENEHRLDWRVVGGESGPGARPFDLAWARQTIAQGRAAGVPVFCKQMGNRPFHKIPEGTAGLGLRDRKGGDPAEWPEDLRVREYPR